MVKKYVIQFIVIFISLILVSNMLSQKISNDKVNSLYFDDSITKSAFKVSVKKTGLMDLFINTQIKHLIDKEYDVVYENLTENSKKKFKSSEEFGKVVLEKYFNIRSVYKIDRLGYYPVGDNYLFCVDIQKSYYLNKEEEKMEVYQPKQLYLAIYEDENQNYKIEWNYEF